MKSSANILKNFHLDDIAVWADGTWATLQEIWNGEFNWLSDDYEIVRLENVARLSELGLAEEMDL